MQNQKKTYRTTARTKITDFLKDNSGRSVTASDIQTGLKAQNLDINISTVYRYLHRLSSDGLINSYSSDKGDTTLYQYAGADATCNEHLHLQCTNCQRVIHLDCDFMHEINEHIMDHHGFSIECRGSILYGLCNRCRQLSEEASNG